MKRKLVTYPRTDARVLSTAISKEIDRNIKRTSEFRIPLCQAIADADTHSKNMYQGIEKTQVLLMTKQITDHYAIIPTGQGLNRFLIPCRITAARRCMK